MDYNNRPRYFDGGMHDPPPLQLDLQEEASRPLPALDRHQPVTMMHYHPSGTPDERIAHVSTGGHHTSSSSHAHAQIVPHLADRLRTAEAEVEALKAQLQAAQLQTAQLMHSLYTGAHK